MEVLKDAPSAESFAWNKTAQDELSIRFELKDEDSALQDARVKIEEDPGEPRRIRTVHGQGYLWQA